MTRFQGPYGNGPNDLTASDFELEVDSFFQELRDKKNQWKPYLSNLNEYNELSRLLAGPYDWIRTAAAITAPELQLDENEVTGNIWIDNLRQVFYSKTSGPVLARRDPLPPQITAITNLLRSRATRALDQLREVEDLEVEESQMGAHAGEGVQAQLGGIQIGEMTNHGEDLGTASGVIAWINRTTDEWAIEKTSLLKEYARLQDKKAKLLKKRTSMKVDTPNAGLAAHKPELAAEDENRNAETAQKDAQKPKDEAQTHGDEAQTLRDKAAEDRAAARQARIDTQRLIQETKQARLDTERLIEQARIDRAAAEQARAATREAQIDTQRLIEQARIDRAAADQARSDTQRLKEETKASRAATKQAQSDTQRLIEEARISRAAAERIRQSIEDDHRSGEE